MSPSLWRIDYRGETTLVVAGSRHEVVRIFCAEHPDARARNLRPKLILSSVSRPTGILGPEDELWRLVPGAKHRPPEKYRCWRVRVIRADQIENAADTILRECYPEFAQQLLRAERLFTCDGPPRVVEDDDPL